MLRHLPRSEDPRVLAGYNPADDAGIYLLADNLALVQTVDFFTPIVDDPYTYGLIAAANSLSDVYAMGARPLTALNIAAFPVKDLPLEILEAILRGGADKAAEAGVSIVGGHTVDDAEPKYGLSVTGTVDPARLVTAHTALAGDALVLTKPVGTGVISTALKAGVADPAVVAQATRWMTTLNRSASAAMLEAGANAATDLTGFGLVGHLADLARASGVSATVNAAAVPFLPSALDYARAGQVPGGTHTNLEAVASVVEFDPAVDHAVRLLLADPQTSGGLLIALPDDRLDDLYDAAGRDMLVAPIGHVEAGEPGTIRVSAA